MQSRFLSAGVAFAGLSLLLVGCSAPPEPTVPTLQLVRVTDYDRLFDHALDVLRLRDIGPTTLDEANRANGSIEVGPITSQQWFEFWRRDTLGGYQNLEANLQQIGRTISIEIKPLAARSADADFAPEQQAAGGDPTMLPDELPPLTTHGPGIYRVSVTVEKSRYSAPQRQVGIPSAALGLYSPRTPTRAGLRGPAARSAHWVPLGRDGLLEEDLLAALVTAPGVTPFDRPLGSESAAE